MTIGADDDEKWERNEKDAAHVQIVLSERERGVKTMLRRVNGLCSGRLRLGIVCRLN